jgi:hypothetical protein
MKTISKKRKLALRNLSRMVHYGVKEAKGRTLKDAMNVIRRRKSKPFFRTSKRAQKTTKRSTRNSIKKDIGWDSTTKVVKKKPVKK